MVTKGKHLQQTSAPWTFRRFAPKSCIKTGAGQEDLGADYADYADDADLLHGSHRDETATSRFEKGNSLGTPKPPEAVSQVPHGLLPSSVG